MSKKVVLILMVLLSYNLALSQSRPKSISVAKVKPLVPAVVDYRELKLFKTLVFPSLNRDNYESWPETIAFSPDSRTLATGLNNFGNTSKANLILWDTASGMPRRQLTAGKEASVNVVTFFSDRMMVSSSDGGIQLWNPNAGKVIRNLGQGSSKIAISPDGKMIASNSAECDFCEDPKRLIQIRDMDTGKLLKEIGGPDWWPGLVSFSPDGKLLAGVSWGAVHFWDTSNWSLVRKISIGGELQSLTFSSDGNTIAVAGGRENNGETESILQVWNVATGRLAGALIGHSSQVNAVTFSPDGNTIASGGNDGSVRLWDAKTGKLIAVPITLRPHVRPDGVTDQDLVLSVSFSPDGTMLAAGTTEGTVVIWKI